MLKYGVGKSYGIELFWGFWSGFWLKKHATRLVIKTVVADSAGLLVNQLIQLQGNQILSSVSIIPMTLATSMFKTFSLWDTVAEGSSSDPIRLPIGL